MKKLICFSLLGLMLLSGCNVKTVSPEQGDQDLNNAPQIQVDGTPDEVQTQEANAQMDAIGS